MPGPLPQPTRRRTNAPTIPTSRLPIGGRSGPVPRPPKWVKLGASGRAFWAWAWKTPQAAGWAPGHEVVVARRAMLEDDLAMLEHSEGLADLDYLLDPDMAQRLRELISRLAAMATGRLALMKEMRELDDRLGLSPKGMAALRWTLEAAPEGNTAADASVTAIADYRALVSGG